MNPGHETRTSHSTAALAALALATLFDPIALPSAALGSGFSFSQPSRIRVHGNPSHVALADFDGDGHVDAVFARIGEYLWGGADRGSVEILLGDGRGGLRAAGRLAGLGAGPAWVGAADLDADGDADLVVSVAGDEIDPFRARGAIEIFENLGRAEFRKVARLGADSGLVPGEVAVADLDGNGSLDLAATSPGVIFAFDPDGTSRPWGVPDTRVAVFLSTGRLAFGSTLVIGAGYLPVGIRAFDIDGDGDPDLAVACLGNPAGEIGGGLVALLNQGTGGFDPGPRLASIPHPIRIEVGDVDGDGDLDDMAVSSTGEGNRVTLLAREPNGEYAERASFAVDEAPYSLSRGRVTSAGRGRDLVTASLFTGTVVVIPARGTPAIYGDPIRTPIGSSPCDSRAFARSLALADVDEDGLDDAVVADDTGDQVMILLSRGDGGFRLAGELGSCIGAATQLASGDTDGDGRDEIVAVDPERHVMRLIKANGRNLRETASLRIEGAPVSPVLADLNADGRDDLVLADLKHGLTVALATSAGSFAPSRSVPVPGFAPVVVTAGDATGDGRPDLVSAGFRWGRRDAALAVLAGNGRGAFGAARVASLGASPGPTAVAIADLDGDRKREILVSLEEGRIETLGLGLFGSLLRRTTVRTGSASHPRAIVTGDFDADGRAEAVVALSGMRYEGGRVVVEAAGSILTLGELGRAGFATRGEIAAGTAPVSLAASDLDRDGAEDAVLSFLGQSLTDPQSGDDGGLDLFAGTPGGLALPERWPSSPMPASVVPGDFDGDGRTDLAVAGAAAGTLSVYWNEGGE